MIVPVLRIIGLSIVFIFCWSSFVLYLVNNIELFCSIRDFQIKKCPKTNAKTLPISSLSVFSVPLWFVCSFIYWDNLFPGSPLVLDFTVEITISDFKTKNKRSLLGGFCQW